MKMGQGSKEVCAVGRSQRVKRCFENGEDVEYYWKVSRRWMNLQASETNLENNGDNGMVVKFTALMHAL